MAKLLRWSVSLPAHLKILNNCRNGTSALRSYSFKCSSIAKLRPLHFFLQHAVKSYCIDNQQHTTDEKPKENKSKGKIKQHKLKLKSTISDHDMEVKIKQVKQWIDKGSDVKITISNMTNEKATARLFKIVCKAIEPQGIIPTAQTTPNETILYITQKHYDSKATDTTKAKLFKNEALKNMRNK